MAETLPIGAILAADPADNRRVSSGLTVEDAARRYRVSPDKVRGWIALGELKAVNTAARLCGKPRWVIPPEALADFEKPRRGGPAPKPEADGGSPRPWISFLIENVRTGKAEGRGINPAFNRRQIPVLRTTSCHGLDGRRTAAHHFALPEAGGSSTPPASTFRNGGLDSVMIAGQLEKQQTALLDHAHTDTDRGSSVILSTGKRPETLVPTSDQIPAELRTGPNGWATQARRRTGKPAKLPINPANALPLPNRSDTWGTFDAATTAAILFKLAGVGRVIVADDGLAVLDLDGCRDANGRPDPWAAEILDRFGDSYAEVSPSGTGYRAVVTGHPPAGTPCRVGPVELYTRDRYVTFTGWRVRAHPVLVAPAGDRLRWLADNYLWPASDPRPIITYSPIDLTNAELLARGTAHKLTGGRLAALLAGSTLDHRSPSEADYELARLLGFWCGGDADRVQRLMRASEAVRDKWTDHRTYLAKTVSRAISRTSRVYTPTVSQPLPHTPTREDTGVPLRPLTISDQACRLVEHIRGLRRRTGSRSAFPSVRPRN